MNLYKKFPRLSLLLKVKDIGFKKALKNFKAYEKIKDSDLFDEKEYLKKYKEIDKKYIDPLTHYLSFGYFEGKKTKKIKKLEIYLKKKKDYIKSELNPLVYLTLYEKNTYITKNYDSLKTTLKGKNGYLFLVNDTNKELRQHFDDYYINKFKSKQFRDNFLFKTKVFEKNNIDSFFFIVPDKSIVCKKYLPFHINKIKRNYDSINDLFPDFSEDLACANYFKHDSHMNFSGGKLLCFKYLNFINNNFKKEDFDKLIRENTSSIKSFREFDLLSDENWSYSDGEKYDYNNVSNIFDTIKPNFIINKTEEIPEKFKFCKERISYHFKNENPYTNLKCLIFNDSAARFIQDYIALYFKETFFYWDHGTLDENMINWFKPDLIIEIRIERFLENLPYPEWVTKKKILNFEN